MIRSRVPSRIGSCYLGLALGRLFDNLTPVLAVCGAVAVLEAGLLSATLAAHDSARRPIRLDDVFDREEIGRPQFSPDGVALVFTKRRAVSSQVTNALVVPETRDDVWVQMRAERPARNLTNGGEDGSGWWDPKWSPDGRRIAFLSSRGGNVPAMRDDASGHEDDSAASRRARVRRSLCPVSIRRRRLCPSRRVS